MLCMLYEDKYAVYLLFAQECNHQCTFPEFWCLSNALRLMALCIKQKINLIPFTIQFVPFHSHDKRKLGW